MDADIWITVSSQAKSSMKPDIIADYTAAVGFDHRRKHGQFFTPFDVATFMCRWVMAGGAKEVFDPSIGLGSFYFAAKAVDPDVVFRASEIDHSILRFILPQIQTNSISVVCEDYLSSWNQEQTAIVCNPPYMRFQLFINREKVIAAFACNINMRLSGYTNIASAFLAKSLSELKPAGRLAYIMPLEFLNTGYGIVIKERLLQNRMLKALIKINTEKDVFPDATTSVGIILVANDNILTPVKFYTAENLSSLSSLLEQQPTKTISHTDLNPADKWLKHFDARHSEFFSDNLVTINTYGTFSRGIATGANEYFAVSRSTARQHNLPRSLFLRCITRSAQVTKTIFTEDDLDLLESSGANVLLLNLNGVVSGPARDYLDYGEKQGFHLRYLTKVRTPWYKLEKRNTSPLLFGVFSRDKFKVIRNLSSAINLTCYHCFYPNLFGQIIVDALFLYLQSHAARRLLELNMRRYGDSLDKFEPNDLNRALAPSAEWFSRLSSDLVKEAMEECKLGRGLPQTMEDVFNSLIENTEQSVQTG